MHASCSFRLKRSEATIEIEPPKNAIEIEQVLTVKIATTQRTIRRDHSTSVRYLFSKLDLVLYIFFIESALF